MRSSGLVAVVAWGVQAGGVEATPVAGQRPGAVATVSAGLPRPAGTPTTPATASRCCRARS